MCSFLPKTINCMISWKKMMSFSLLFVALLCTSDCERITVDDAEINAAKLSHWLPNIPSENDSMLLFSEKVAFKFGSWRSEGKYLLLCMSAQPENQKSYHSTTFYLVFRMDQNHMAFKEGKTPTARSFSNTPVDILLLKVFSGEDGRVGDYGWESCRCSHVGDDVVKVSTEGKENYYLKMNSFSDDSTVFSYFN